MCDIWMDVDAALAEVPVNLLPLLDDTDFKTRETAIAFNAAGMDLVWNFVTPAGAFTQTAVTPTSGGDYDWAHQGDGMYTIEIPASGGASINNDTEGFGWFTGVATGVLPWRGPVIGFRAAGLNDALIESAYSTTRGLAGTALPAAAAEAAGGLYTRGSGAGQINQTNNGRVDVDPNAAGVRTAVGLASANLDTQLAAIDDFLDTEVAAILAAVDTEVAAIKAKTDSLTFTTANQVDATTVTNSDKTGYRLSATGVDDIHDEVQEGTTTFRQMMRGFAAVLLGKASGLATTSAVYRDIGDSKDRITATVDADGNRTAVTRDLT